MSSINDFLPPGYLDGLDQAEAELGAGIKGSMVELIIGGLPFLGGLVAVGRMVWRRRRIRRERRLAIGEASELLLAAELDAEVLEQGPPTCAEEEAGLDSELIVRLKLAMPEWARLEYSPESQRWAVIDVSDVDPADPVGAPLVTVLHAPGWAATMTDDDLRRWAAGLARYRAARE